MLWAIAGFFLILTPIILVHEYGHFIVARLFNIKVEEFGLGFPPRAMTLFERNGTLFTLNWIPLGGFVRPAGEDDPNVPGGLSSASKTARLSVLVAGAVANFIFALLLFWIYFMIPQPVFNPELITVSGVRTNSPAERAGLQDGDLFISINGAPLPGQSMDMLIAEIQANAGQEVTLVVERSGELVTIALTPRTPEEYGANEGSIGVGLVHPPTGEYTQQSAVTAVGYSAWAIWDILYTTFSLPAQVYRGEVASEQARVVSVVGISQIAGQVTQQSVQESNISYLLSLTAVISVALGFTNLLPIPALDGGRIVFVLIEAVRGRRVNPENENKVHAIGMALLLALMVLLIAQDLLYPIILPS